MSYMGKQEVSFSRFYAIQDGQGDLFKGTKDNVPEIKSTFFLL